MSNPPLRLWLQTAVVRFLIFNPVRFLHSFDSFVPLGAHLSRSSSPLFPLYSSLRPPPPLLSSSSSLSPRRPSPPYASRLWSSTQSRFNSTYGPLADSVDIDAGDAQQEGKKAKKNAKKGMPVYLKPIETLDSTTVALAAAARGRPSKDGHYFVDALLNKAPVQVPETEETKIGMEVWNLGSELALDQILLRQPVRSFWKATAAKLLDGNHVVVIGSPGVGKSSTHPYLLRLLLQTGRPVVFLRRGMSRTGIYHEFRPKDGGGYEALEYDERDVKKETIPALTNPKAFLLIEPMSQRSPPEYWIQARIALVCYPDDEHFRGMEKTGPDRFGASFRYFPHWTLEELYAARPFICDGGGKPILANNEQVYERYLRFGPIPRYVFSEAADQLEERQNGEIMRVRESSFIQILEVVSGKERGLTIDASDASSPSSYIVSYESTFPFSSKTIVLASAYVEEALWRQHKGLLWQRFYSFEPPPIARHVFEEYCRDTLANLTDDEFLIRLTSEKAKVRGQEYFIRNEIKWPIENVDAHLKDFSLQSGILYNSLSDTQKVVNALVQREDGGVDGFQFTAGKDHKCPPESLGEFASKFGTCGRPFRLYYVVPSTYFPRFKTDPVRPGVANAEVYVLSIPPPL